MPASVSASQYSGSSSARVVAGAGSGRSSNRLTAAAAAKIARRGMLGALFNVQRKVRYHRATVCAGAARVRRGGGAGGGSGTECARTACALARQRSLHPPCTHTPTPLQHAAHHWYTVATVIITALQLASFALSQVRTREGVQPRVAVPRRLGASSPRRRGGMRNGVTTPGRERWWPRREIPLLPAVFHCWPHRRVPTTHRPITPAQRAGYGWVAGTVRPVAVVAELATLPGYLEWMTPTTYVALAYIALVWVAALLAALVAAGYVFISEARRTVWPQRLLAVMGPVSATVGYIPILYLLLSCFNCHLPAVRGARRCCYCCGDGP